MRLSDLNQVTTSTDTGSIASTVTTGIQALGTAATELELEQLNIQRAKQGLPPVNSATVAPTVNVGVASSTLLVVGGLALLFLVTR